MAACCAWRFSWIGELAANPTAAARLIAQEEPEQQRAGIVDRLRKKFAGDRAYFMELVAVLRSLEGPQHLRFKRSPPRCARTNSAASGWPERWPWGAFSGFKSMDTRDFK